MDNDSGGIAGGNFSFDGQGSEAGENGGTNPRDLDGSSSGDSGGSFGSGSREQFDPAIHVAPDKRNKDGSYTKKRGRKGGKSYGQNNSQKANDLKGSVNQLSNALIIVHAGIASATKTPEFVIDKDEGDLLANAAVAVMAEFDVTPDPKTQAIVGAIVACATVYGPRAVSIRMRKAAEKAATDNADTATVYNADGSFAGATNFNESASADDTKTTFNEIDPSAPPNMPAGKGGIA